MRSACPNIGQRDIAPPPRRTWRDAVLSRGTFLAFVGLFACIAWLGLVLFLPRPAPAAHRHAAVDRLFVGPKIGLRAEALGRVPSETEAASR